MMSQCFQISETNYNKNAEIRSRLFETRIIPRSFMRAQRNDFVKVFKESLCVRCNADISRHLLPVSSPSLAADLPCSEPFCSAPHYLYPAHLLQIVEIPETVRTKDNL